MFLVLLFILLLSIFLQAAVISIPVSFVILLVYTVIKKDSSVFPLAFFTGLMLDIFTLKVLGTQALFLILFFALVHLYQRKYEIQSLPFVIVSSFGGAYLYLVIFTNSSSLFRPLACSMMAVGLFSTLQIWELRSTHSVGSGQAKQELRTGYK